MLTNLTKASVNSISKISPDTLLRHFSDDLNALNKSTWINMQDTLVNSLILFIFGVMIVKGHIILLIAFGVVGLSLFHLNRIFLKAMHEIKKIEQSKKQKMRSQLKSNIEGLMAIRGFRKSSQFSMGMKDLIYQNMTIFSIQERASRLFGVLFDVIIRGLIMVLVLYITHHRNGLDAALIGIVLYLSIIIPNNGASLIHQGYQNYSHSYLLGKLSSATSLPEESSLRLSQTKRNKNSTPENWPSKGEIHFRKVQLKYGNNHRQLRSQLNLDIKASSKVGIIGITDFDISLITNSLFRMTDIPDQQILGKITIDGVDINEIELEKLRNSLTILSQNSVLMNGTLRKNLDPQSKHSDDEIWQALEDTNLQESVDSLENKLDTEILSISLTEDQKRLLSLARAILRKSNVLVLEDPSNQVSAKTEAFVQAKISEKFLGCTIIAITHNVTSIAGYDQIIVMDKGNIIEEGSPYSLLVKTRGDSQITRPYGWFVSMVKTAGNNVANRVFASAHEHYKKLNEKK
jgi:ATP-binding cassette subfamily C (CFTR/MRP) protein 4